MSVPRKTAAGARRSTGATGPAGAAGERWGQALVWSLVVVTPWLVFSAAKESFRLPKLLVGDWLGLASLLPLAWGLRRAGLVGWRDAWREPAVQAVLPPLLVANLGALLTASHHPFHVREALADLWIGSACLVGWSLALPTARLERLLRWLLLPAAGLALLGILQYHSIWRPFSFAGYTEDPRLALTSTAGNPGDLAAYLVLPCLIAQWLLARRKPAAWEPLQWAAAAALALSVYAMALTQALAPLAAAGAGTLLFWGLMISVPGRRWLVPAVACGLLVVVAAMVALVPPLRLRAQAKVNQALHGDWNAVLTGRLDGWRAAAWMLRTHPLAGVGQGAYRAEFIPAKLALMDRGVPFYVGQQQGAFSEAHNDLLEAGADWGVPGLVALGWSLWVLMSALRRGRMAPATDGRKGGNESAESTPAGAKAGKRASPPRSLRPRRGAEAAATARRTEAGDPVDGRAGTAFAWSAAGALALLAFFDFPFRVALVAFPALLVLAWILRRGRPEVPDSELGQEPVRARRPADPVEGAAPAGAAAERSRPVASGVGGPKLPGEVLLWPATTLLVTALLLQSVRLLERKRGSELLSEVEIISTGVEAGRLPTAAISGNLEKLRTAARLDPVEVGIPIALGAQFLLLNPPRPERALAAFASADRLEPVPKTAVFIGKALLLAGHPEEARQRFALALRLDPTLQAAVPPV